jgi:hypothetical protein
VSLNEAKERSQSTHYNNDLGSVDFEGQSFNVKRGSAQRYNFILENGDLTLNINIKATGGRHFPEVHIRLSSAFLWRQGWQDALRVVQKWVNTWAEVNSIIVSRCDLTADFSFKLPVLSPEYRELVARAKSKQVHDECRLGRFASGIVNTGFTVGKQNVLCRVYDKLLEVKKSDKGWFKDIWARQGWQEGLPVSRVEFQLRRPYLRQMKVDSPEDLTQQVGNLWHYLTGGWLTIREIGEDSHRTRWAITPAWQAVQSVRGSFGEITGVTRSIQSKPKFNQLKTQARGLLVSMVAIECELYHHTKYEMVIPIIRTMVTDMMRKVDFELDVERRRARYSGITAPPESTSCPTNRTLENP